MSGIPLNWVYGWRWYTDIHPKSEWQYKTQKGLAGILPGYAGWMQSRAYDEQMANLRNRLGLSWSDIKSPWIAGVSGGRSFQSGTSMVSKNLNKLYR